MYFPYFRGKQFELILLREQARFLKDKKQVPIIAPVRSNTKQLEKTISALNHESAQHIVILNPSAGDHASDPSSIFALLNSPSAGHSTITGIKLTYDIDEPKLKHILNTIPTSEFALIHAGYQNHTWLATELQTLKLTPKFNIFTKPAGRQYRNTFSANSVEIRDGFQQMRNRDYPPKSIFPTYTLRTSRTATIISATISRLASNTKMAAALLTLSQYT